jgi:putative protein kinase ArgK-like GTPase of G3E family
VRKIEDAAAAAAACRTGHVVQASKDGCVAVAAIYVVHGYDVEKSKKIGFR